MKNSWEDSKRRQMLDRLDEIGRQKQEMFESGNGIMSASYLPSPLQNLNDEEATLRKKLGLDPPAEAHSGTSWKGWVIVAVVAVSMMGLLWALSMLT